MRYTRYEYKKSGSFKFILAVVIVAVLSITAGLCISNVLFTKGKSILQNESIGFSEKLNNKVQTTNIVVLQCGFYSKKENADVLMSSIKQYCYPFISEEDGNYRVIAGIYNQDEAEKKIKQFQENGVEVSKTTISLKPDSNDDKKIIEISDGFLKIMSKLEEADVKSIKTNDFKNWCNNVIGNENEYGEKLKAMINYVHNLPDEIDKNNNSSEAYEFYKLIKR
ncbi:MAG: SPOR domain-containing protein [Clostridium butyricum]|nr:SPOR domain-containing protein [Clostridium butyricum]